MKPKVQMALEQCARKDSQTTATKYKRELVCIIIIIVPSMTKISEKRATQSTINESGMTQSVTSTLVPKEMDHDHNHRHHHIIIIIQIIKSNEDDTT